LTNDHQNGARAVPPQPMTPNAPAPGSWPRVLPCGDAALTVELGDDVDRRTSARVIRLHRRLRADALPGMIETLPAFRSLTVRFDPRAADPAALAEAVLAIIAGLPDEPLSSRCWRIPVCYAPEFGLDLAEAAERCGMTPDELVERQASTAYYVYMIGFLPGHPYLGDLPMPLRLPRRKDPRIRVPRGSLAIATGFAVIYPFDCPGGWNIIGRTPVRLFDAVAAEPSLLAPGDEVRFEPVSLARFEALAAAGNQWRPS
jgi:KipI family sensor histidine kinase inhibitor